VTLQTPVALIIFNRPECAARVFAEIAKVKPRRLFVFADGPRPSQVRDAELCAAARQVVERVDRRSLPGNDYSWSTCRFDGCRASSFTVLNRSAVVRPAKSS